MSDAVNSPAHYTSHPSGIECKDIIKHHSWAVGSAIKYLWRQGIKGGKALAVQDLRKAIKCIEIEIERVEELEAKEAAERRAKYDAVNRKVFEELHAATMRAQAEELRKWSRDASPWRLGRWL